MISAKANVLRRNWPQIGDSGRLSVRGVAAEVVQEIAESSTYFPRIFPVYSDEWNLNDCKWICARIEAVALASAIGATRILRFLHLMRGPASSAHR